MNASGIGGQLRSARLARNLSLAEVSQQTKIAPRFLESIEAGRFDDLPGVLFARNFVRQYASVVALDPAPLLAGLPQLDDAIRQLPAAPRSSRKRRGFLRSGFSRGGFSRSGFSRGFRDGRRDWLASSVLFLLLALGAGLAIRALYNHNPRDLGWRRASAASPAPAATPPVQPVAQMAQSEAPGAGVSPATQHPVDVVVTALQAAWVQLTADGKTAFTGTLQPHETREVGADEKVKIVAGNAGGLAVSLNGKKLDSLGPSGQVRVITLTAAGPEPPPRSPQPPLPRAPAPDQL